MSGPRDAWEAGHAEHRTSGQRDFKSTEAGKSAWKFIVSNDISAENGRTYVWKKEKCQTNSGKT